MAFESESTLGYCPADGDPVVSDGYALQCSDGGTGVEAGWRRCGTCTRFGFTGKGATGACAAGGNHDMGESGAYALTVGTASSGDGASARSAKASSTAGATAPAQAAGSTTRRPACPTR